MTGKMPFSGKDNRELTKSILENRYAPLGELLEADVSGIADIVERALAWDPSDRYASATRESDDSGRHDQHASAIQDTVRADVVFD